VAPESVEDYLAEERGTLDGIPAWAPGAQGGVSPTFALSAINAISGSPAVATDGLEHQVSANLVPVGSPFFGAFECSVNYANSGAIGSTAMRIGVVYDDGSSASFILPTMAAGAGGLIARVTLTAATGQQGANPYAATPTFGAANGRKVAMVKFFATSTSNQAQTVFFAFAALGGA
jgi:hypothetical protein